MGHVSIVLNLIKRNEVFLSFIVSLRSRSDLRGGGGGRCCFFGSRFVVD